MDKIREHLYKLRTEKAVKDAVVQIHAAKEEVQSVCAHSYTDGVGTKATGYALPENGPFDCAHCAHADEEADCCDHPAVIADPDVPKDKYEGKTYAKVHPDACCNYFHPKDKGGPKE